MLFLLTNLGYNCRAAHTIPLKGLDLGMSDLTPPLPQPASLFQLPSYLCFPDTFPEPGPAGTWGYQGQRSGTAALTLPNSELWKFLLSSLNQVMRRDVQSTAP